MDDTTVFNLKLFEITDSLTVKEIYSIRWKYFFDAKEISFVFFIKYTHDIFKNHANVKQKLRNWFIPYI